jgi:MFS family permease
MDHPDTLAHDPSDATSAKRSQVFSNILRALKHRNYRLFFGGQIVSLVGTFLTQTATAWFVYRLTGSAEELGIVACAGQLPLFLFAPFAGVWADRVNRQKLIVLTQTLSGLQSFALACVAYFYTNNAAVAVPWLIALAVVQGLINAFDMPARQAFLVEMVTDRADLANAIALNSTMVHGARLVGPALAGLIIHFLGESLCFLIDSSSYIAVIIALLMMRIIPRPPREPRSVMVELKEGFHYVWSFTPIRTLLLLMALISLAGMPAFSVLLPIFGMHFGGIKHGALELGFLGAASGVGAFTGALYLASRRTVVGLGRLIATAAAIFSLALIAFSRSDWLWLSLLIVPIAGWGMIILFASANTILQTLADDDKRGRVMSFFSMAFVGMAPFGVLMAGFAAAHLTPAGGDQSIGASRTLLIAGIISLLAAIGYYRQLPAMRKIIRPIYIKKGILPQVAAGLQVADEVPGSGEQ